MKRGVAGLVFIAWAACFGVAGYLNFGSLGLSEDLVSFLIAWLLFAVPSLSAARLLIDVWWNGSGHHLSTMDGPARLLSVAVHALPSTRKNWAAAMEAELAQVQGRSARWSFAADSARAALFPPLDRKRPVVTTTSATVVMAAATFVAVGLTLPALQHFAVTLVIAVGLLAVRAATQTRRIAPSPTIATIVGAAVAGAIATTVYVLWRHPVAGEAMDTIRAVLMAAMLTGCLWIVLTPPRNLMGSRRAAWIGVIAGCTLGAGFWGATSIPQDTEGVGAAMFMLFFPALILFVGSLLAAALDDAFRSGFQAAVWGVVTAVPLILSIWLFQSMWWYEGGGGMLIANDYGPNVMAGNLTDAMFWCFVWIPVWALPFGVFGAAVSGWRRNAQITIFQ